jgi:hypothetical protein
VPGRNILAETIPLLITSQAIDHLTPIPIIAIVDRLIRPLPIVTIIPVLRAVITIGKAQEMLLIHPGPVIWFIKPGLVLFAVMDQEVMLQVGELAHIMMVFVNGFIINVLFLLAQHILSSPCYYWDWII